jgi:hypothetical protein
MNNMVTIVKINLTSNDIEDEGAPKKEHPTKIYARCH